MITYVLTVKFPLSHIYHQETMIPVQKHQMIFSSRFFPQHILDSNDEQIHEDDDISILTCIQQDFDLEAIHATEEPYQSQNHCLVDIK